MTDLTPLSDSLKGIKDAISTPKLSPYQLPQGVIDDIDLFVTESNAIEGIKREGNALTAEVDATLKFLQLHGVSANDIFALLQVIQPDARIRDRQGMDVIIGNHFPPEGGLHIVTSLNYLLKLANEPQHHPHQIHIRYEHLHPWLDGNGRTGRALWLWGMIHFHNYNLHHLFLQAFYYQTLNA